jgi:hypothetical protein
MKKRMLCGKGEEERKGGGGGGGLKKSHEEFQRKLEEVLKRRQGRGR